MGDFLSKPSPPPPPPSSSATTTTTAASSSASIAAMSSPISPQSEETPNSETLISKSPTDPNPEESQQSPPQNESINGESVEEEEDEDEGECGFCLFMKAGGCRETFTSWEKCVEEGERKKEDIVEKCYEATSALKKCMEAHSDYYAPLLEAEKAAEEEAAKQLAADEKEKEEEVSSGEKAAS